MEFTRYVRWRHDDNEGFLAGVYLRSEIALLEPKIVPLRFNFAWLVGFGYFSFCLRCFCHGFPSNYVPTSLPFLLHCHSRESGNLYDSSNKIIIQITPLRIILFNKLHFPAASPLP